MSEQHENINWKQVAIQEIKQRRILEHKVEELHASLLRAKQILQRTQNYKEHLESSNSQLEHQYATKTADFQRAINLLHKSKSLLQQRQIELDIVTHENSRLNHDLQQKIQLLHAEMTQQEETQHRLNLALQQLELAQKINALPVTQPQPELCNLETNIPIPHQSHLHEFFVYKPFISRV